MAFPTSPTNGQITVVNNISYQYSNVSNSWSRILSTANIITANTLVSSGYISAAGNISTGNYFIGNGSLLTGIASGSSTSISNGTSNVAVASSGGNVRVSIGGTSNVIVYSTTGEYVTGVVSANGNITGGNLLTSGLVSATANITGGNILTAGLISVTGTLSVSGVTTLANLSAGNISSGGITSGGAVSATGSITSGGAVSATGNITGGNLSGTNIAGTLTTAAQTNITSVGTLGSLAVTANITGGNLLTGGLISSTGTITGTSYLGSVVSVTGNVSGGNVLTGGLISAAANITAPYFIGNGAALTGLSASKIFNGTSEANIGASGGNANISIGGTSNVVVVATTGVLVTGIVSATGNVTGGNILTGGLISSTGNAIHSNLILNGTAAAGSGVLIVSGNIQTSTANATANIGNASNYFNRLFAQATTALYADLAEVYRADAQYPPGTVLVFGGTQEVTMSTESHDVKIAGVVSTHPAHVMNSGLQSEFTVEVGLIGRVPCQVIGPIAAGDQVVSSNLAGVAERLDHAKYRSGMIIGKALQSYSSTEPGTIEVVVGRL